MSEKIIGKQIRKARMERQLTQSDLGKKIGVTWEMISRYENGKSSSRKNLEKIAKVLSKPIQFFFGVEEAPITDEIARLSNLLESKRSELIRNTDVPLLESLGEFSLDDAVKLTHQRYTCPSWIRSSFRDIFAFKLDEVESDVVSAGVNDIGFFTSALGPLSGSYILLTRNGRLSIEKYSKGLEGKVIGTLLAIERRYIKLQV
ncbi:MAG: helix-turn-helix transcriptional regulator [Patescibacteria group bacterium]|nr:helix-turn-helix domain-containing protein [Patescibacteria group bacterium]